MPKFIDFTGQRYGRYTAMDRAPNQKRHRTAWNCVCDCCNKVVVLAQSLASGRTKSCGCPRREKARESGLSRRGIPGKRKHGHCAGGRPSRTYRAWNDMKARCHCPSAGNYAYYGGKGVSVCAEWRHDFLAFLRDMKVCPEGYTLDRINPGGNYEPGNVRWATWQQQARNHRNNRQRYLDTEAERLADDPPGIPPRTWKTFEKTFHYQPTLDECLGDLH